jgi:thiamine biosynthesis lipoprotein
MTSETDGGRSPLLGLSPRARILLPVFLVILVGLSTWRLTREATPGGLHVVSGASMGTTYSVKVVAPDLAAPERQRIEDVVQDRLSTVNRLMSTYDPDSELSRFNRLDSMDAFPVSPETLEVFRVAREISEWSGGAFDVTVSPLVAAWGFGATDRVPAPPAAEELASLRERVGYRLVAIDLGSGTLSKAHPATECDLSAIAKGYAVDAVARALVDLGHADFLVEVGGDLRAGGRREDGRPWRVAIERPDPSARSIERVIELDDLSMATSGDYRNYYEKDGVRYSHLIDPRSARPIAHRLASVSVLHPNAVQADAMATALSVLGPAEGYALAEREDLAAYFIVREPDGAFRARATSAFALLDRPADADATADLGGG